MNKLILSVVSILIIMVNFIPDQPKAEGSMSIRFLHAATDSEIENVDVYINKEKVFENIPYKELSSYKEVPDGKIKIRIFTEGSDPKMEKAFISHKLKGVQGEAITVVLAGDKRNINVFSYKDDLEASQKAKVRFVNLSPNMSAVDFIANGERMFNLENMTFSKYREVDPDIYQIELFTLGNLIYKIPNLRLKKGSNYSIIATGVYEGKPQFDVLITKDK